MVLSVFTYYDKKGRKTKIRVKICKDFWSKMSGLMFKKNSPNLLFVFSKEQELSIHSFFCQPFKAIWLDEKKQFVDEKIIVNPGWAFSARGKYLIEIPLSVDTKATKK